MANLYKDRTNSNTSSKFGTNIIKKVDIFLYGAAILTLFNLISVLSNINSIIII